MKKQLTSFPSSYQSEMIIFLGETCLFKRTTMSETVGGIFNISGCVTGVAPGSLLFPYQIISSPKHSPKNLISTLLINPIFEKLILIKEILK
jgi:hypothetical protein